MVSIHALLVECDWLTVPERNPCWKWFQSTHSLWSATQVPGFPLLKRFVSIHALLVECDAYCHVKRRASRCFNPRTPCGVRPMPLKPRKRRVSFQSTHSLWSATDGTGRPGSIVRSFNPRTPCGVRPRAAISSFSCLRFQSTHSLWSATHLSVRLQVFRMVSIHALLVECDRARASMAGSSFGFNPRTPCGVRRDSSLVPGRQVQFQSTHSLWSATKLLRIEMRRYLRFQSTHSLWSATSKITSTLVTEKVSIHALLVECDRNKTD